MALDPNPRCGLCKAISKPSSSLSRCSACKVTFYCSREHQATDRYSHKKHCNAIKKAQKTLDAEEIRLCNIQGDFMTPDRLFEDHVGHFWGIMETRHYMRKRFGLVEALLKIDTYAAVIAAHDHLMDMLRLCRSDNMGVRSHLAPLKLRLGRDQECHDFCLWWAKVGEDSHYDWGDLNAPYLNIKNADVFQPAVKFLGRWVDLSHATSITLIKIRLYLDLRMLRSSAVDDALGKLPTELVDYIKKLALSSSIMETRRDVPMQRNNKPLIRCLEGDIRGLYLAINASNMYYWQGLLDLRKEDLTAKPPTYSHGSEAQMQYTLQYTWKAWVETPGALDHIRALHHEERLEDYL